MDALGRLFDIGLGWAPVDIDTANAATGKRLSLARASGVTFVVAGGVGAADDLVLDVQQHTAYTGGTSADLDVVTKWWIKAETALDNDESWVKVEQTAASECTVVGATYGAMQKIVVIEVDAASLSAGYSHVSLNAAVTTATAQLTTCLYIVHDLAAQRTPSNLGNLLRPGAANA
jgi:hypothetical protein